MGKYCRKKLALFLTLILTFAMGISAPAAAAVPSSSPESFDQVIRGLLSKGDYIEGEAIAIVRGEKEFRFKAETEDLSIAGAEAVGLALEGAAKEGSAAAKAAENRFSPNEGYSIVRVTDPSMTTEELLKSLLADPRVVTAEPNYTLEAPAPLTVNNTDNDEKSLISEKTGESEKTGPGDLTGYQWYIQDSFENGASTPEASGKEVYSLNVPHWNGEQDNASGTIAIMDTGIDTTHPDLQDALFEFSEEQQERFACGPYGKNVNVRQGDPADFAIPEDEYCRDITAHMMHGTHLAGMIAGAWDGSGISGITKGAKIFGVRVYSDDGMAQSSVDIVRGFEWLIQVAKEVNLKAVNVSLGTLKSQIIHTIMVNKLGEQGVVTVYASGNFALNMDETVDLGGENNIPYAITVNAANPDGKKTQFSCYGQNSTDVFAPGAQIISSIPRVVIDKSVTGTVTSRRNCLMFFPESTDEEHLAFGKIEKFDTDTPGVLFFDACPVNEDGTRNKEANETGKRNEIYGFDDSSSWEIPAGELSVPEDTQMTGAYPAVNSFWMAVPVEDEESAEWIGGKGAYNDETHIYTGVTSVLLARKNADDSISPVSIDMRYDYALALNEFATAPEGGYGFSATSNYSSSQWTEWSINLKGFAECAKYFHDANEETRKSAGYLEDPGDIQGVYLWKDGQKNYVLLQMAAMLPEGGSPFSGDGTCYLMDDIAAGDDEAAAGAYLYMSGTSMAAPCVTACLAVIAKDEPANNSLEDEELKEEALERAAKLLACVDYDEDLAAYCRTGGRVNLNGQTEFTRKAPIITDAKLDGTALTITGYFFGDKGSLYIDDKKVEAASWSDGTITADVKGLTNRSHVVKIVNEDEAVSRVMFGSMQNSSARSVYENTLSLPIREPGFEEELTDGFYGSMPYLDGSFYVLTGDSNGMSQGMWRYDTASDKWLHCASLPEKLSGMSVENNSLAAAEGKIWMYVYRKGFEPKDPELWSYSPDSDTWEKAEIEGLRGSGQIISFEGRLLFVAQKPYTYDESADPEVEEDGADPNTLSEEQDIKEGTPSDEKTEAATINFIDTGKGVLVPVGGDLKDSIGSYTELILASSGRCLYVLGTYDTEEEMGVLFFDRLTYDEKKNEFVSEDLSKIISRVAKDRFNLTLTGIDDGVAIITPKTAGRDTYILKNDASNGKICKRTSSYHTPFAPAAGYDGEKLYVLAMNATEPDVLYFRSTKL